MTQPPFGLTDGWLDGSASDALGGQAVFGSPGAYSQGRGLGSFGGDLAGSELGRGGGGAGAGGSRNDVDFSRVGRDRVGRDRVASGASDNNGDAWGSPVSTPDQSLAEPTPIEPGSGESYLPDPLVKSPTTEIPPLGESTPPPYTPPQSDLVQEDDPTTDPGATIIDLAAGHDGAGHLPEPGTLSLLSLGVLGLGWRSIRTRRKA